MLFSLAPPTPSFLMCCYCYFSSTNSKQPSAACISQPFFFLLPLKFSGSVQLLKRADECICTTAAIVTNQP